MDEIDFLRLPRILNSPLAARWAFPQRPSILAAAPIILEGGEFQIHPDPSTAPERAWRPIIAIRIGSASWPDQRCAIAGDIIDFAALSPAADRVIGLFYGTADVIGNPPDELFAAARGVPWIHIRRTPADWLNDLCGAVLVRPIQDSTRFLRQFATVIVDEISHGTAIERALRRAYTGPEVRLATTSRAVA